jgi:hypothetical protein
VIITSTAVKPFAMVPPACMSLWESSVSSSSALSPVFTPALLWPAAAAAPVAAVTARPKSRVEAIGVGYAAVGYAAPAGAETRRGVDGIGRDVPRGNAAGTRLNGTNGTNGKQQDQLHLMSRRDPRTWRPPA